jgi:hypothetical protein
MQRPSSTSFAGKRDQRVVAATGVAGAEEVMAEDTAFEIAAEFTLEVSLCRALRLD